MTLGIDEVNTISIEEEIREYFSVMDITKKQKEEREEAAKDLFPTFLFLFALLEYAVEYDLPYEYVINEFRMQFGSVAYQYYDDASEYIDRITEDVLNATLKDIVPLTLKDGEHWLSPERALELSENEANSLLNYQELKQAIEDGYTNKTWVTERDNRVRDDHRDKEGETIPIAEYFEFPDCEMLCPHDVVNGTAKQVAGCRCSLRYKREKKETENSVILYADAIKGDIIKNNTGLRFVDTSNGIDEEIKQNNARSEIKRRIATGEYSLDLNIDDYNEHIFGHPLYLNTAKIRGREPSRLFISYEEAQSIIKDFSGTGIVLLSKNGKIMDQEFVTLDRYIGEYNDGTNWIKTRRVSIHHGKHYSHIVPVKEVEDG